MRYFQDTGLLLLYCLFSILYTPINLVFILAFLCATILCCSGFFIDSKHIKCLLCFLYLAAALVLPAFFFFFPVPVYILFREAIVPGALLGILFFLYHFCVPPSAEAAPALFGGFALLLAFFLQFYTRRDEELEKKFKRTRDDSRELNLLLSEKNKDLMEKQDYEIYTATLKERNRIAREIHDNVGHVLSRSILMVGALKAVNKEAGLTPMIENLDISLNSAMDSIRNSVHDLHDDSVNLEDVVHGLVNDFSFCPVDLLYDMSHMVPREIKYCFISITKEGLANIMKHSHATRVHILMREHPALYQLCIEDNGPAIEAMDSSHGIGLLNMRERIAALKGTMQVATDNGFKIFITIPKE
ncbi:MAG: sensor histidine kinase [Clostridia bacterium]|nr:histidine kinase [Lachnospiraceae bacterium]NCB99898.1 sensor histidine kinase [Clostridia bacterium]NCD03077.1 sensor histidine kinase [Clostridia bacterium]